MTREEARVYFIDSNERIISVAKDENGYNYETQQIENVFMRRDFEAKEMAIKALDEDPKPIDYYDCSSAMLKLWMENIVTDSEYYRIIDKLNARHKEGKI